MNKEKAGFKILSNAASRYYNNIQSSLNSITTSQGSSSRLTSNWERDNSNHYDQFLATMHHA